VRLTKIAEPLDGASAAVENPVQMRADPVARALPHQVTGRAIRLKERLAAVGIAPHLCGAAAAQAGEDHRREKRPADHHCASKVER
jgi:hypothetical protein